MKISTKELLKGFFRRSDKALLGRRRKRVVRSRAFESMEVLEDRVLMSTTLPQLAVTDTTQLATPSIVFDLSIEDTSQTSDQFGRAVATGDFNGDGYEDLAVGSPYEDVDNHNDAGAVNVIYGGSGGLRVFGDEFLTQDLLTGTNAENSDLFGWSLTSGDFDNDGFDDLAVGSPFEDWGSTTNAGVVHAIYGSSGGLIQANGFVDNQIWHQDSSGIAGALEAHDRFGYALAAGDFNEDGRDDLAIGAPYEGVDNHTSAGAVNVIAGSAAGLTSSGNQLWTQDPLTGTNAEANDRFGWSLTAGDFDEDGQDDLVIGSPYEHWGATADAGVVHVIYNALTTANTPRNQIWKQDVLGETIEANDRFGFSLAAGNFDRDLVFNQGPFGPLLSFSFADDLVIGVPGEDFSFGGSNKADAGIVHVVYGSRVSNGLTSTGDQIFDQSDLAGTNPEAGDQFGYSLAVGNFDGSAYDDLIVGSPFEDWGSTDSAGVVHKIKSTTNGLTATGNQIWHQNTSNGSGSIQDMIEAGDRFGFALAAGDFDNDGFDDLAVGVPLEDIGSIVNAGAVNAIYGSANCLTTAGNQFWHQNSGISILPPLPPIPVPVPPVPPLPIPLPPLPPLPVPPLPIPPLPDPSPIVPTLPISPLAQLTRL